MLTITQGLTTPYTSQRTGALEQMRKAVMDSVFPSGTDSVKVARAFAWVLRSDLRSYFPGASASSDVFSDGPSTTEAAALLDAAVPPLAGIRAALPHVNVTPAVLETLRPFLENELPQRRLEGYCALACICALRRDDE